MLDDPTTVIAILGAAIGAGGFMGGIVASRLHTAFKHEHQVEHVAEGNERDADLKSIRESLKAINQKLDVDIERLNDAISVIMTEGGQVLPEFAATIRVRSPHTYRYYVLHERD